MFARIARTSRCAQAPASLTRTRVPLPQQGNAGGRKAKLQVKTTHPSPNNVDYGACHEQGKDENGEPVSRLASYSKQPSTVGAESVRHMPREIGELGAHLYSVLRAEGALSEETIAIGGFTSCQVREYDGDLNAETNLHTDTRVGVDGNGELKEIDQACGR